MNQKAVKSSQICPAYPATVADFNLFVHIIDFTVFSSGISFEIPAYGQAASMQGLQWSHFSTCRHEISLSGKIIMP